MPEIEALMRSGRPAVDRAAPAAAAARSLAGDTVATVLNRADRPSWLESSVWIG